MASNGNRRSTSRGSSTRTRSNGSSESARTRSNGSKVRSSSGRSGSRSGGSSLGGSTSSRRGSATRQPSGRERRERHQRGNAARRVWAVLGIVVAVLVVAAIALFAIGNSPLLAITSIEAEPTEHVSEEDIQNLVQVEEGTTLFNVDTDAIEESLKQDTWVKSVSFVRSFPNTLKIVIEEQDVEYLVVMSSGNTAWYLSSDGTWIEPVSITTSSGQSVNDAALEIAQEEGILLVTDVPSTVAPEAGATATDDIFDVIGDFREGFSSSFNELIVSYSAPSTESVSCVLSSGIEVSLGSATNVSYKEEIVTELISEYPGQITYINVRTPSNATYRKVSTENVTEGSGTSAISDDSTTTDETVTTDESTSEDSTTESADEVSSE